MSYLNRLLGKSILSLGSGTADSFHLEKTRPGILNRGNSESYIQFKIGEFLLNVYNPISTVPIIEIDSLIGKKIIGVIEEPGKITFTVDDGGVIIIDLRDSQYTGPEAMVLYGPNNLCVVWN